MKRVRSLVFHTIDASENFVDKQDFFDAISAFRFDENLGFGLSIQDEDDTLKIKVVKRSATFINDYDNELNEFVRKQIYVFSDFQFCVDFKLNIVYVYGGISHINYVKYILRHVIKTSFNLVPVELTAYSFYEILLKKKISNKIENITISHFNYQNELVGRFSGTVITPAAGLNLLETYKTDIVKVSFLIQVSETEQFILHALPNGALKFLSNSDDLEFLTDYLKNIIFS